MKNEPASLRDSLHRRTELHHCSALTIQQFNDLTWRSHSSFVILGYGLVPAVAGLAAIERATGIDRSLLPLASPRE
jgi:hypothetical protein